MRGKKVIDFDERLEELRREKEVYDKKAEIRQLRKAMRPWHPPTTTKILMIFIFANCTAVEIYSMAAMWYLADLSSLYALITSVISESISFGIYCAKAYNETKQEELIRLERDKMAAAEDDTEADEGEDDLEAAG